MTELLLDLSFACTRCEQNTYVTVHCSGPSLAAGPRITVKTEVPCYCCGTFHTVLFHPTGEVVGVEPTQISCNGLIPSRN